MIRLFSVPFYLYKSNSIDKNGRIFPNHTTTVGRRLSKYTTSTLLVFIHSAFPIPNYIAYKKRLQIERVHRVFPEKQVSGDRT